MRTEELEAYMLNDPYIRHYYGGVVPLDKLPKRIDKQTVFIVNTDPAHLPGKHWLAVFFTNVNEHFDSSGFYPNSAIEKELITHGPKFCYNTKRVQAFYSDTCGLYCLFYCYFRCRGLSFREIIDMFTPNLHLNEHIVNQFYESTK